MAKTRQIRKKFTCSVCDRTVNGYENQRWNGNAWVHEEDLLPDDWKEMYGSYFLCDRCVKNPKAIAKVKRQHKVWVRFKICVFLAFLLMGALYWYCS